MVLQFATGDADTDRSPYREYITSRPCPTPNGVASNPCSNVIAAGTGRIARFTASGPRRASVGAGSRRPRPRDGSHDPVFYTSAQEQARVIYTSDNEVKITPVPGGTKTHVKDWKENERPN